MAAIEAKRIIKSNLVEKGSAEALKGKGGQIGEGKKTVQIDFDNKPVERKIGIIEQFDMDMAAGSFNDRKIIDIGTGRKEADRRKKGPIRVFQERSSGGR
jgi:hypothetical protein